MINIYKDQDLDNQKFKSLLMHIAPTYYAKQEDEEVTVSTEYLKEIEEKLGRPLTKEELDALGANEDLDFIG